MHSTLKRNISIIIVIVILLIAGLILYNSNKPKGLVALVIDDWGYNRRNIELLLQIDRPLTISILPNLPYSDYVAKAVRQRSEIYDIILHLPLESKTNIAAERDTIRSSMGDDEILSLLKDKIESIPGVIGVSNHQGSKATEDKRVMKLIFDELKERRLFFLDSITTPNSVCQRLSRDIGLKYAERDVFLDITDQTDLKNFDSYIKGQIQELASIAVTEGSAIGIGHNRRVTLEVLKDVIPQLEQQGIKIVPLKTLIR